jgi:DNA-binding NtrC family response regulator
MTVQARATLRAVVLPAPDAHPQESYARRLLGNMGHDVSRAASPDHAMELLSSDHTDLLVVDITNNNQNRALMDSISSLPESRRPDQVAIFSDEMDPKLNELRRAYNREHFHVFLKPLHMHGLLNVIRHMEKDAVKVDA